MDQLVSVLRERWDGASGDPSWTFSYAELGELAEQFPGTSHSIQSSLLETTGEIRIRIKLLPDHAVAAAVEEDHELSPYNCDQRIA